MRMGPCQGGERAAANRAEGRWGQATARQSDGGPQRRGIKRRRAYEKAHLTDGSGDSSARGKAKLAAGHVREVLDRAAALWLHAVLGIGVVDDAAAGTDAEAIVAQVRRASSGCCIIVRATERVIRSGGCCSFPCPYCSPTPPLPGELPVCPSPTPDLTLPSVCCWSVPPYV